VADLDDLTGLRPVDAVLFDAGGVFVVPSPSVVRAALTAGGQRPAPADSDYVDAPYLGVRALDDARGAGARAIWPAYFAAYAAAVGLGESSDAAALVGHLWGRPSDTLWNHVLAGNVAGLRRLSDAGVVVGVVSNSDGTIEGILAAADVCQVGPGAGVDVPIIVDSSVVGVAKPDPAVFAPALDHLGVDPARTVYVGDTVHYDVHGALAAGLVPVQVDPLDLRGGSDHMRISGVDVLASVVIS
jgi:putative hydrolase of the HAD superfamily